MARRDPNLLTQAQYARWRKDRGLPGGTREAVRQAIDAGDISAFGPDKQIDPELADRQWAQNRRARISAQASGAAPAADAAPGGDLVQQAQSAPAAALAPAPVPVADSGYTLARAERERAEADKAKMEVAKLRGELVAWQDVARGGFEVGRDLRDTMESAVNALSAELASETNPERCAEILRKHHRAVCDVLVRAWREKIGPVPAGVTGA